MRYLFAFLMLMSIAAAQDTSAPDEWDIPKETAKPTKDFSKMAKVVVVRVVDGDTVVIKYNDQDVSCRLVGIDTPETVHPSKPVQAYGKEASNFLKNLLKGESIWIEQEPGNKADKYNRQLIYAYRAPDGLFVNEEIVRQGYGHAYTVYPFKYMEQFREFERKAREAGKGLWAESEAAEAIVPVIPIQQAVNPPPVRTQTYTTPQTQGRSVFITNSGKKYHVAGCQFLAKSKIPTSLSGAQAQGYTPCSKCRP